jgi:hypothetical protein
MYKGPFKRKKMEFIKLVDKQEEQKDLPKDSFNKLSQRGVHLFLDKNLVDKSQKIDKGVFSELLANIIKEKKEIKSENKIYNFYNKTVSKDKISVIKQFYTPALREHSRKPTTNKNLLLTQIVKNKKELTALKEYISNRRTDSKLYERILKNILAKGYKQLPKSGTTQSTYPYSFDEKIFMKYNFIIQKETNLKFVLDELKNQYVTTNNKPKSLLNTEKVKLRIKSESNLTTSRFDFSKSNDRLANIKPRVYSAVQKNVKKDSNVYLNTIF